MSEAQTRELARRLREAGEAELGELVAALRGSLGLAEARLLVRNPFVTPEILETLAQVPALVSRYELRWAIAGHPRAPRALALRFVGGLYWRDLARLGIDLRVHPVVRRAADRRLLERLPGMAIGEKSALARRASAQVVAGLRLDPSPRVIAALLDNPRLTESLLLPLASHPHASPASLAVVAASARWAARPAVRAALCRNPATPLASATRLLPGLPRDQLRAVASETRLPALLRALARQLLGAGRTGASRRR